MSKLDANVTTRSLTIVLPEDEWHALRSIEPDAIGWLQDRIRERIGSPSGPSGKPETFERSEVRTRDASYWGSDEY
jgi:hypothetical protein